MRDETDFNGQEKTAFKLWAKTYPNNGVGETGLISRLSDYVNMDEDDITTIVEVEGSLAGTVYNLCEGSPDGEEVSINDVAECVYTDSWETTYEHYFNLLPRLVSINSF